MVYIDKKYIMLIITILSLFITLCMVNETYAKYVTSATTTTSSNIARWKILVNNDDITLGTTSNNLIAPVFPGSADIAANVLAPNTEGYFDLVLDGSEVDVSFKYTITIGPNPNSPVNEITAVKYIINGGQEVTFGSDKKIEGTIRYGDTDKVKNIRVYVKWDDTLDLMDNAEDTDATKNNQKGLLDISINVIQI